METPFLSQAYVGRSRNLVFNQAVNIYPEIVDDKSGKRVGGFYGCPGSRFLAVVGTGPHRGARVAQANGGLYCVSGSGLYQVSSGWAATLLGSLSTPSGPVAMMDGTEQIVVVDGSGNAYVWNFSTSAFSTVALGFNADTLFSQDGFFLANQTGTSTWWQSNLNDGSTWNALNFSSASAQPDPIVGGIDINREAWLMKANGIEIWYNAGNLGFVFSRIPGVYLEQGCAAPYSIAKTITGPVWVGSGERGAGIVWMAEGYTARRISTHAIETALAGYPTFADAQGFIYEDSGHVFYVLTLPTANATWCCDLASPGHPWHQRAYFGNGQFSRHRMASYAYAYGQEVFGDYEKGTLYAFDLDTYTDAGEVRKWLRTWRALPANRSTDKELCFNRLRIDLETGISVPAGTNPQLVLRWSDDGAHTWSSEYWTSAGQTGQSALEAQFISLGSTTRLTGLDRTFELSGTDPIKVALIGADLDVA